MIQQHSEGLGVWRRLFTAAIRLFGVFLIVRTVSTHQPTRLVSFLQCWFGSYIVCKQDWSCGFVQVFDTSGCSSLRELLVLQGLSSALRLFCLCASVKAFGKFHCVSRVSGFSITGDKNTMLTLSAASRFFSCHVALDLQVLSRSGVQHQRNRPAFPM